MNSVRSTWHDINPGDLVCCKLTHTDHCTSSEWPTALVVKRIMHLTGKFTGKTTAIKFITFVFLDLHGQVGTRLAKADELVIAFKRVF